MRCAFTVFILFFFTILSILYYLCLPSKNSLDLGGGLIFFTKSVMQQYKGEHPNKNKKTRLRYRIITVYIGKEPLKRDIEISVSQQKLLR